MGDLVVIFRTMSDIEAGIVRSLLDTHGISSIRSSDVPEAVFPVAIHGLREVRIAVRADQAEEARRLIASFRRDEGWADARLRQLEPLEDRLGYRFRDRGLLEHALTHRSRAHEDISGGVIDNESLEFLGDALLGFVIADLLFRAFPDSTEGEKSKIKASLVSAPSLGRLGERLELGEYLLLGRGEEKTGGRRKQALLADGYEALIAAMYLDGGIDAARAFIEREFQPLIEEARQGALEATLPGDYKSALQEWLQSRDLPLPDYRLVGESGPEHRKVFDVELRVRGEAVAQAEGRSKKDAEQQAARRALERLRMGE